MSTVRATACITLQVGLVSVPLRIISAKGPGSEVPAFRLSDRYGRKVRQVYQTTNYSIVKREDLYSAVDLPDQTTLVFSPGEMRGLRSVSTEVLEVVELVSDDLDPMWVSKTDYLLPGKSGERGYALLVKALRRIHQMAICNYASRGVDYLVAVESDGSRLLLRYLRWQEEVRDPSEVPVQDLPKVRREEVNMAVELLSSKSTGGSFDPSKYMNPSPKVFSEMIKAKRRGNSRFVVTPKAKKASKAVDLMAAIKASLDQGKAPRPKGKK